VFILPLCCVVFLVLFFNVDLRSTIGLLPPVACTLLICR